MENLIRIDRSGRLTLPIAIRKKMNLHQGGVLKVQLVGDHIELIPVNQTRRTLKKAGSFLIAEADQNHYDAVANINAMRKERW